MKLLVIGGGAREHALCWRLKRSPSCTSLYCAPGNAGIETEAVCLPDIGAEDVQAILDWCTQERPDLVIIGPDGALAAGLVDALTEIGVLAFGPTKAAARIEWSKAFMKDLARTADIPTAPYGRFTDIEAAKAFIETMAAPIVVKADGLALGKGVLICQTQEDAIQAAGKMLSGVSFGTAGREIVIEAFLSGFEVSYFALVDGETVVPLTSAQDHKRVGEGDTGPNTGGMGAISPAPGFTNALEDLTLTTIIQPFANAMVAAGTPYRGVIFAGLMIVEDRPILIEFNARFGDPECQSLMRRWTDDPVPWLTHTAKGALKKLLQRPVFSNEIAIGVVLAAQGYPDAYSKHTPLSIPVCTPENVTMFHAGTSVREDQLVNTGGRTLTVVATGPDAERAQEMAYAAVNTVKWDKGFWRRDIGWRALQR